MDRLGGMTGEIPAEGGKGRYFYLKLNNIGMLSVVRLSHTIQNE